MEFDLPALVTRGETLTSLMPDRGFHSTGLLVVRAGLVIVVPADWFSWFEADWFLWFKRDSFLWFKRYCFSWFDGTIGSIGTVSRGLSSIASHCRTWHGILWLRMVHLVSRFDNWWLLVVHGPCFVVRACVCHGLITSFSLFDHGFQLSIS